MTTRSKRRLSETGMSILTPNNDKKQCTGNNYQKTEHTDFYFKIGNKRFYTTKHEISTVSPIWKELIDENSGNYIDYTGIEHAEEFEILLDMIFAPNRAEFLTNNVGNFRPIFELANKYQIKMKRILFGYDDICKVHEAHYLELTRRNVYVLLNGDMNGPRNKNKPSAREIFMNEEMCRLKRERPEVPMDDIYVNVVTNWESLYKINRTN
jgi:hypothetical protein